MNKMQMKLENPSRIEELKPQETLQRIGLQENHVLCDIGAGTGIFTIPGSRITKNNVYALEISDEMLEIISSKARTEGIRNIKPIKVNGDELALADHSIDIVLMVTVLHEIENKAALLKEVKRILNSDGKVAIIEFHKRPTPIGPPVEHRLGKNEVVDKFRDYGFGILEDFDLGENFYTLIFTL